MIYLWVGFVLLVLGLLALDLFVFHRKAHEVRVREALLWSAFWIALALAFNVFVYFAYDAHWLGLGRASDGSVAVDPVDGQLLNGGSAAAKFFTGYVLEKSLSVDNLFVIALIFSYFAIPPLYQHRVLFWGIVGALVMRGVMIGVGAALIDRFDWILYVFGIILLYTAYKMVFGGLEPDPKNNFVIRMARRFFPVTHEIHGMHFVIRDQELSPTEEVEPPQGAPPLSADAATVPAAALQAESAGTRAGKLVLTPLALALIVVETTDLIFAVDSIPAIFGITGDPFIVFTSNIFAILGLRSLYFALAGILDRFEYLKYSLAGILGLVGVKMLLSHWLHSIPNISYYLLGLVALILGAGIVASMVSIRRAERRAAANGGAGAAGTAGGEGGPPHISPGKPPEPAAPGADIIRR